MAKTIEQLENNLRIKFLIKERKYYLFFGSGRIIINGEYCQGYDTLAECKKIGVELKPTNYSNRFIF